MDSSLLYCFIYSVAFLFGIYCPGRNRYRNDPSTIKYRFVSVSLVCLLILLHVAYLIRKPDSPVLNLSSYAWEKVFIRFDNIWEALYVPILLTSVLYLGTIIDHIQSSAYGSLLSPTYWKDQIFTWSGARNLIVAPASEEFVFRACIIFHLQHHFTSCPSLCFLSPLFFSIAHLHHIYEQVMVGEHILDAFLHSLFQVLYTTVFGAYSAFLLLRTANVFSAIVAHTICNFFGLPDFVGALQRGELRGGFLGQILVLAFHALGVYLWYRWLFPMSESSHGLPYHAVTCHW